MTEEELATRLYEEWKDAVMSGATVMSLDDWKYVQKRKYVVVINRYVEKRFPFEVDAYCDDQTLEMAEEMAARHDWSRCQESAPDYMVQSVEEKETND